MDRPIMNWIGIHKHPQLNQLVQSKGKVIVCII